MQPEPKSPAPLSESRRALLRRYLRGGVTESGLKAGIIPRRKGSGPAPLSYSQQQIWLHSQLAGDALIYNEPITIHRHGELDRAALERSLLEIVGRHEAWRTTFEWNGDQPIQIVQPPPASIEIPFVDLREIPLAEREPEAIRLATADALQPFDLAKGPMYRMRLARLSDSEHRLFITLHHIIFDGVSLYRVLLPELQTFYEAFTTNQSPALAELPIQYPDYAIWQRDSIKEIPPEHLSYWQRICDDIPTLDLQTDRPRPASQTYAGAMSTFEVPAPTAAALRILSHEQGATPFMTMTAAFMALLHGYTGQEDIAVGGVSSGRHHKETMNLLGCFLNTVVIRCAFSKNLPFTEMLARVRGATLEALSHDEVPFELLVQRFASKRDPSRAPLVQALIVVEPPLDPLKEGWAFTHMDVETGTAKFDLQLGLDDRPEGLVGRFIYNTDLFDRSTIRELKSRWLTLLDRIAADPSFRVRELTGQAARNEKERDRILTEWNDTAREFPQEATLAKLFEAQVARTPEAIALFSERAPMTYRQLNTEANQLAHYLQSLGVGPEILVGICLQRSSRLPVAILAILKAGGAYVPMDPAYPKERLKFLLEDTRATIFLTEDAVPELPSVEGTRRVSLDSDAVKIAEQSRENVASDVAATDLAYVIYTSGSTGQPKGVALEHRNAVALIFAAREIFTDEELSGVLASTSVCFDLSVFEMFVTLSSGGALILVENALALSGLSAPERVTLINTVPSAMRELLRNKSVPSSVRVVNLAGEFLDTPLVDEIYRETRAEKVYDLYGPSETTTYSTFTLRKPGGPATIGRPLANEKVYLLDPNQQPVPIGGAGEIYIGGAGVARGYLHRPELTAEKFVPNPFEAGGRFYRTGDLGRWRSDGNLEFLGRMDQQVKIRGFRIELGEIEAALKQQPEVEDCAVLAREDRANDKRLVAYVVRKSVSADFEPSALLARLRETLPDYMVPHVIVALPALPRTPNGKLDRNALPAPRTQVDFAPAKTPREKDLAALWASVLGLERVGRHDNFFEFGGHSLLGLRLVNQLREITGRDVPFTIIFEAPTVAEMAKLLEKNQRAVAPASTPLVAIDREARRAHRT